MKRRIIMVSAMILLLASQANIYANNKAANHHREPGKEMHEWQRHGHEMPYRHISQQDIERVQNFYWAKYRVRLSKKEAEKIAMNELRERRGRGPAHHGPKGPQGPQRPPRK